MRVGLLRTRRVERLHMCLSRTCDLSIKLKNRNINRILIKADI